MIKHDKLDQLFKNLAIKAENCKNILEFKAMADLIVQEAINENLEIIQEDEKTYTEFITKIFYMLKLSMPLALISEYSPVIVITEEEEIKFGFAKKGAKTPSDVTVH